VGVNGDEIIWQLRNADFVLQKKHDLKPLQAITASSARLETSKAMSSEKIVIGTCQMRVRGTKRSLYIYTTDFR
jgi:hypothetical protein